MIFTMDVEEWYHAENLSNYLNSNNKSSHKSIYTIEKLLKFLEKNNYKGTFFVLGVVAKSYPKLIHKIYSLGHEIANHGYDHTSLFLMNEYQLEKDIRVSTQILEDIINDKVIGYRSPTFSFHPFLNKILKKNGYKYTSNSITASFHDRYYSQNQSNEDLIDFPIPYFNFLFMKFPITGGGWFRFWPTQMQNFLLKSDKNYVFYCHPWDFDINQPILKKYSLNAFRHYYGIKNSMSKLEKLSFGNTKLRDLL